MPRVAVVGATGAVGEELRRLLETRNFPVDGEPVFLLHGFPQTNYEWRFQITALSEAGYRVIAPNQRGYSAGARPLKVDDYALDVIASDVIAMADALDVERFHLVGHDFGGAAGWQAAAAYPERVASFTSISTPHPTALFASIDDPASDQAARSSYFDVFVQPDAADLFIENDAALLRGMYGSIGLSEDEIEGQLEVLGSREAIDAALNWYRAGGLGDTIGPSTVPTMYIWSDADDALGPDPAAATGDYVTGDYRYEVLDGIDHWVPERAPDAVNALLLDFLSDQDAL